MSVLLSFQDFLQGETSGRVLPKPAVLYNLPDSHPLVLTNSVIVAVVFVAVPLLYTWIMVLRFVGDRYVFTSRISKSQSLKHC
jgi:hypothetical protein